MCRQTNNKQNEPNQKNRKTYVMAHVQPAKPAATKTPAQKPVFMPDGNVHSGRFAGFNKFSAAARSDFALKVRVCGCLSTFFQRALENKSVSKRKWSAHRFSGNEFKLSRLQTELAEATPMFGLTGGELVSFLTRLNPTGRLFSKVDGSANLRYMVPIRMNPKTSDTAWAEVKYDGDSEVWYVTRPSSETIIGGYGGVIYATEDPPAGK